MKRGLYVILNGPPGSGKDAIANQIRVSGCSSFIRTHHAEIKEELFKQALAISGISRKEWFDRYDDRELKEKPWKRLGMLSQREFMIKLSENFTKPIFGKEFYGMLAADSHLSKIRMGDLVIFSDGGFQEELEAMAKVVGSEQIFVVRLHREGCSFDKDSRDYLEWPNSVDIHNDRALLETVSRVKHAILKR